MADRKISELTNITGANVDDANDEIAIVDASASETKAITREELFSSVSSMSLSGGTIDGTTIGGTTAASGTFTDLTVDEATLTAIAETKADTAVDVFVYDTSKDSDGGAWRKRTQGTSWYNETLNTATRGSRREFPAVAVIVAEADKVTIYDGDDPALPMWMVFNRDTSTPDAANAWWRNASGIVASGLSALNAKVCISLNGTVSSSCGLLFLDFASDNAGRYSDTGTAGGEGLPVADTFNNSLPTDLPAIVDSVSNDVAMTTLPDAPIDPATGLPVPTIAVATNGGTSVITDSGDVYDSSATVQHEFLSFVDGGLWFGRDTSMNFATYADIAGGDGFGDLRASSGVYSGTRAKLITRARTDFIAFENDFAVCGDVAPIGLQRSNVNYDVFGSTMNAFITSSYNTGYQPGDIKGAFLSDTDDTDLVGSGELVTNGDFGTGDLTGWTDSSTGTGSVDASSGAAEITKIDSSNSGKLSQTIAVTSGQTYIISFDVSDLALNMTIGTGLGLSTTYLVGSYTLTFVANDSTMEIAAEVAAASGVGTLDNISVKLADEDRSVNNNGLIVNGTVTRSPVATGADLVAYSGFSASNYLEMPYNSDLDFGTGDFCVMGWVKTSDDFFTFVERYGSDLSQGLLLGTVPQGGSSGFRVRIDGVNKDTPEIPSINSGEWALCVFVRDADNGYFYVNGMLEATLTGFSALDASSTALPPATIGVRSDGGQNLTGSLALLRISATAPTAEQIAKIYNDEKFLFQENAQATLYGASDAVTALAHDPVTYLLHVGTSDGRSVFQGLRRVSNTTDAVTTAISASNDLIVEQ